MRRSLALLALLLIPSLHAAPPPWQPDAETLLALHARTEARWQRLHDGARPKPHADTREFIAWALDAVASGTRDARIDEALRLVASQLDTDPASKTYGNIRWYLDDNRVVDQNGVEFVTRQAALLWLRYRDRLDPSARETLHGLLASAREGILRHRVAVSYTNIHLMKTWNLLALGQALNDPALVVMARQMLADWLAQTARHGITEYLSPTYYAIDLECLALIHRFAADEALRSLAARAQARVWEDVALNWYAPAGRLAGVHSRDYDRLYNHGDVDLLARRAGWPGAQARLPVEGPYEYDAWEAPPDSATRWLGTSLPRTIVQRWGDAPWQRSWNHLGADFSIGSAESNYHNMDTAPLAVNLGAGSDVPVIGFTLDGRGDFYGRARILETGSGHLKSLHLRSFIASVQRGPAVLFAVHGGLESSSQTRLDATVILPADARYWLDGRPLQIARPSRWRTTPGATGSTRAEPFAEPDGHVAMRLVDDDAHAGIGLAQEFEVEPATRYRLVATLRGGPLSLYLNFYDAAGHLLGGEQIESAPGSVLTTEHAILRRAPAGAARGKAWVYSPIAAVGQTEVLALRVERLGSGDEAAATIASDDFALPRPGLEIASGSTLVVARGSAALALRLIGARGTDGHPVGMTLTEDGLDHGALRLSAHLGDAPTDSAGTVAMLARAGGGLDEAGITRFVHDAGEIRTHWQLARSILDLDGDDMHLTLDLARRERLRREGGEAWPEDCVRCVDGVSLPEP